MKLLTMVVLAATITAAAIIGVNAWALVLQHMIDSGMVTITCEVQK